MQAIIGRAAGPLTLTSVRASATRLYTAIAWLHVPAVAIVAISSGNAWLVPTLALAILALGFTVASRVLRDGFWLRSLAAIVLTAAPIAFVYVSRGAAGGWQIDYHMYFFAIFAMLIGYVDWRPIAVAAALTAGHHLLLDLIDPTAVFPEEGLDRVALHALCVVAECSVLFWACRTIAQLFGRVDELIDITATATAEAIMAEQEEKALLRAQLAKLSAN
ncbi:MAG: hypothetical protein KGN02_06405 [bacterium]|nr:hypothetical protein [bacterium]